MAKIRIVLLTILILSSIASTNVFAIDTLIVTVRCKENAKLITTSNLSVFASSNDAYTYEAWQPIYLGEDDNYAYKNRGTGKYLTVLDDGTVTCEATSIGTSETFDQIYIGSGYSAILSHKNNLYVNANHANSELKADLQDYTSDYAKFVFSRVVDMATVVSAFAKKYPYSAKGRTYSYHSGITDYYNDYVMERYNQNSFSDIVMCWRSAVDFCWIYDGWVLGAEFWGINSTVVDSPSCDRHKLLPYLTVSKRFIGVQDIGQVFISNWTRYTSTPSAPCTFNASDPATTYNAVLNFGVKNFGGDVGTRWYVKVGSADGYGGPACREELVFDLGPAENDFSPQYGLLEYIHHHDDTNDTCDEIYSDIVSWTETHEYCGLFYFDE